MGILSDFIDWIERIFNGERTPEEKIDTARSEIQDDLSNVKSSIADITTQKKRLEIHRKRLRNEVEEQEEKAERYVREGDDEHARDILRHKKRNENRIEELTKSIEEMSGIQDNLSEKKRNLGNALRDLKTTQSSIEARKKAAQAEITATETLSDYDGESVDDILRNLERETERLEAKAEVINSDDSGDNNVNIEEDVNKELEELKERS